MLIRDLLAISIIFALLALSALNFSNFRMRSRQVQLAHVAHDLHTYLVAVINDPGAFDLVITDPLNQMECIKDGLSCIAVGSPTPSVQDWRPVVRLYSLDRIGLLIDLTTTGSGLNRTGGDSNPWTLCSDFNNGAGNCDLRPEVHWRPLCVDLPCVSPPLEFRVRVHIARSKVPAYNPVRRQRIIVKK